MGNACAKHEVSAAPTYSRYKVLLYCTNITILPRANSLFDAIPVLGDLAHISGQQLIALSCAGIRPCAQQRPLIPFCGGCFCV